MTLDFVIPVSARCRMDTLATRATKPAMESQHKSQGWVTNHFFRISPTMGIDFHLPVETWIRFANFDAKFALDACAWPDGPRSLFSGHGISAGYWI